MNVYPSTTDEFLPVTVTVSGTVVTGGVSFSVVQRRPSTVQSQPGTFIPAVARGNQIGVRVFGFAPGIYDVWAQVVAPPDTPVILAGQFETV